MPFNRYALAAFALLLSVASCKKDDDFVENKVPVADAGPSSTITIDSAVVTGKGTDADGQVVAYLWSQVSGPVNATIVNPGAATTTIRFNKTGSYLFQLMVTDNKGATGVDTMMVTVNQPAGPKTLTLQPATNPTEYEVATLNGNDASGPNITSVVLAAWTASGNPYTVRGILKFDLSSIPANATISSATLYLYSDPKPSAGDQQNANYGTANAALLQMITAPWSIGSVGWFNQPSVNTANQVVLAQTNSSLLDVTLDVKSHVAAMVSSGNNYGWLMRLQNEVTYNSRIFVGSRNQTYPDKRPKLVVVYQ